MQGLIIFPFYNSLSPPTGAMKTIMDGFLATQYLLPLVKIIEILVGLAFLSGKFMRLAAIALLPISVNILLINTLVAPEGAAIGLFVFLVNLLFMTIKKATKIYLQYSCLNNDAVNLFFYKKLLISNRF